MRVPLAFQVASARDFCVRSGIVFPAAQDEISGAAFPAVLNTLILSDDVESILMPSTWFTYPLLHLLPRVPEVPQKMFIFYLMQGRRENVHAALAAAHTRRLNDYIASY